MDVVNLTPNVLNCESFLQPLPLSCVCAYVFLWVCVCVCVGAYACGSQRFMPGIFLNLLSTLFFETGPLLNLELISLARPAVA